MGQHVLYTLQKPKVMNLSCTTSSANMCVVLSAGWVAGAGQTRTQYISQARPLGRDDMVRDSCSVSSTKIVLNDCILLNRTYLIIM